MRERGALSADPRRGVLLELYATACRAVDGRRAVRAALGAAASRDGVTLIAVGKAASAMTLGALDVLGARVARGLVISRAGHLDAELKAWPVLRCLEGDHPVPGAASLAAGAALLDFAAATPAGAPTLVLVSGGASSLVEALPPSVSPADLRRVNEWGLGAGLGIEALNAIRRRLSRVKDGRLAAALAHTAAEALLISDVPGDDPAVIGSGLVMAQADSPLPPDLPPWLAALLGRARDLPRGAALPARVVATLGDALAAAERAADDGGMTARRLAPPAAGDAATAASRFAHELALTTTDLLVWGGETSVNLPPAPGRGGRNQHFALATAQLIAGHGDLVVLAAGTDGTDGNSSDAGAIVDGGTVARGAAEARDAAEALAAADSGGFLEASGDLLHTGPTGTNVGDVVLGLRRALEPAAPAVPAGAGA
jgi:hydroxypyruvate reductase